VCSQETRLEISVSEQFKLPAIPKKDAKPFGAATAANDASLIFIIVPTLCLSIVSPTIAINLTMLAAAPEITTLPAIIYIEKSENITRYEHLL
jgi:hypothetical protein